MSRVERVVEWAFFAYYGAVVFIALIPVILLMVLLDIADRVDSWIESGNDH